MKKYTFQMTEEEIREFCIRAVWEQQLLNRSRWLLILALVALEFFIVPWEVPLVMILLLLAIVAAITLRYHFVMKGRMGVKMRSLWVENGMLKLDVEGEWCGDISCGDINVVKRTRHLYMLGCRRASKAILWYPIPLRVFENEQEGERFVESLKSPQTQSGGETTASSAGESEGSAGAFGTQPAGDYMASSPDQTGQEYLHLSFQVTKEEWIRMMAGATEIIQAGTLGGQKNRELICAVLGAVCILFSCWTAGRFSLYGGTIVSMVSFVGAIIFLTLLRSLLEKPEKKIRTQIRKGTVRNDAWGNWEIAVTELGVGQSLSGKSGVMMPWESLDCMVETDTDLFFYQKDKRQFLMFPKSCMEGGEQLESLKGLCREKQLEILAGKRKKYAPNWLFPILTAIVMAGYIVANVRPLLSDSGRDTAFGNVPFEEQVSVLRSLGFTIPKEMEEALGSYFQEDEVASYVERYPYIWLLSNLTWAHREEAWADWFQDGAEVFWFDFEGWDITTDYIMVLEGMRELSAGSILDDVENIREDTENVNWERGTGTITVLLDWRGQEYSFKMNMQSDWIDPKVLGIYNGLLEKEGIPERFYMTGDDGQGALVLYCTKEWASEFEKATGLDLDIYTVKKGW